MDAEPTHAVPMRQRLEDKLRANLKIEHLVSRSAELYGQKLTQQDIVDTSGNCGSSFALTIVSPDFAKKMTLARHKMINQLLAEEIAALHAFSQKTLTPEQWAKEKA